MHWPAPVLDDPARPRRLAAVNPPARAGHGPVSLLTFGHGTASAERIAGTAGCSAEVMALIDVRITWENAAACILPGLSWNGGFPGTASATGGRNGWAASGVGVPGSA